MKQVEHEPDAGSAPDPEAASESKRSPEWLDSCRPFIDSIGDRDDGDQRGYEIPMVNQAFLDATGQKAEEVIGAVATP
ncbi:MAG: hypothetical protein U0263_41030 [Polyangiaceae bacterium]